MTGGSSDPTLSVVIVTFNSAAVIQPTLRSVARLLPEADLVIVDNGSTDDTVTKARDVISDIRVITGHGNIGFGPGVNLGVSASRGDIVLVLNPDAPLTRGSLSSLNSMVDPAASFGLVACGAVDREACRPLIYRRRGWLPELTTVLVWAFLKPREFHYARPRALAANPKAWVGGAAFFVARHEFEQLGGFDDIYFLYCEDTDLSRVYGTHGLPLRGTTAFCVAHGPAEAKSSDPAARVGWTLVSMVEYVAKWDGPRRARAAAAYVAWFLRTLAAAEPLLARLPGIGDRAAKSSRRAATVRAHISRVCDGSVVPPGRYPFARPAFAGFERGDPCHIPSPRHFKQHGP